jgi:uncharacterized heparinase superfamily protein
MYDQPLPPARVELQLPVIDLPSQHELPPGLVEPARKLRAEAEDVLHHRVDFLGSGLVELGRTMDWHRDFKSGYRWPSVFYQDVQITRLDDGSDAKVPWELSRGHQLLTLARAAAIFRDERFAAALEEQLASWLDENPPGIGINWTTSMEVGIRAANLVWAVAIVEGWRPLEREVRERLVDSLRWHGRHLRANLEGTPYLRSNHYLGDLLGLMVLGGALQGDPDAPGWAAFAKRELEREVVRQVLDDGVSFEASLAYHGLVLEMLLVAAYAARTFGAPLSGRFEARLREMVRVVQGVRHPSGRIPLFGDQDSGRVLPAGYERLPTHDPVLWLAAAVVGRTRPLEGPADPEVAWAFGIDAWHRVSELPPPEPAPVDFPHGGIYVLRSTRLHAVLRCGEVGQNGNGGHSHNDLLSYELSVDGVPFVVDSGTYSYTFDVDARNAFRSTAAHSTVMVDGLEMQPIDSAAVFELRQFARPRVDRRQLAGERLELVASHDGYRRLSDPVVHRRRLTIAEEILTIVDELEGSQEHVLRSFIHLTPSAAVSTADRGYEVVVGDAAVRIIFDGLEENDELAVEDGYVSDRYGVRQRAPVLVVTARRQCPTTLTYRIAPATPRG